MLWLRNIFNKHIKACTVGKYHLLILDSYSSYTSAEFDQFCIENMINFSIFIITFFISITTTWCCLLWAIKTYI